MLIEVKTNTTNTRFININQIVMIETGLNGGTFIHLNSKEKLSSPEDVRSLQTRINESFEKDKK